MLRPVIEQDLPELYAQQLHSAAVAEDHGAFTTRWSRNLSDPKLRVRGIVVGELLVGYIAQFHRRDQPEVSYCLGKEYWGEGIRYPGAAAVSRRDRTASPVCSGRQGQRALDACTGEVRFCYRG